MLQLIFKISKVCLLITFFTLCFDRNDAQKQKVDEKKLVSTEEADNNTKPVKTTSVDSLNYSYSFDYPVGKPNADGYYNAQVF